jgi:hypothetical protein
MARHHALRAAGGARRVDHVGEVVGLRLRLRFRCRRRGRRLGARRGRHLLDRLHPRSGGELGVARLDHQHSDPRVLEQEPETSGRVGGVEGDVGAAGAEDPQQAHQHLARALRAQADAHVRADPEGAEAGGQGVGPQMELPVRERRGAVLRRDRVRRLPGPSLDAPVHQGRAAGRVGGVVPLPEQ